MNATTGTAVAFESQPLPKTMRWWDTVLLLGLSEPAFYLVGIAFSVVALGPIWAMILWAGSASPRIAAGVRLHRAGGHVPRQSGDLALRPGRLATALLPDRPAGRVRLLVGVDDPPGRLRRGHRAPRHPRVLPRQRRGNLVVDRARTRLGHHHRPPHRSGLHGGRLGHQLPRPAVGAAVQLDRGGVRGHSAGGHRSRSVPHRRRHQPCPRRQQHGRHPRVLRLAGWDVGQVRPRHGLALHPRLQHLRRRLHRHVRPRVQAHQGRHPQGHPRRWRDQRGLRPPAAGRHRRHRRSGCPGQRHHRRRLPHRRVARHRRRHGREGPHRLAVRRAAADDERGHDEPRPGFSTRWPRRA